MEIKDKRLARVLGWSAPILAGVVLAWSVSLAPDAASLDKDDIAANAAFAALDLVSLEELESLRGGFVVGGLDLEFGANIRTSIDGVPVLESTITFTPDGPHLSPVALDASATALGVADDLQAAEGITLPTLPQGVGVAVNGEKGPTIAIHEATRDRIVSMLVTRASGISASNEVQLEVTVKNFSEFQQMVRGAILSNRLGRQVSQ